MRHRKSGRKLKRTASHRKALLCALATALIRSKRIRTTVAKAKEARMFIEPMITRAKNAVAAETAESKNVHARREVFRFIKDRDVVQELFNVIAPKVANRAGGYTRVVKLGQRYGDAAEIAILELVDFNTEQKFAAPKKSAKKKEDSVQKAE
jgi:large subunit ribosomal protein L17